MLIIRADGNAKIGAGHMMRCLTIAQAVRELHTFREEKCADIGADQDADQNGGVLFLCADENSAELVRDNGFRAEVLHTDYQNMESELEKRDGSGSCSWDRWITGTEHTILVDSYYVTEAYLQKLHAYGRVFLLDDRQNHRYPADVVINYNVFADPKVYQKLYQGTETRYFLGAQYAPLREQFRKAEYGIREEVRNVLITTGGGDADNIAAQILDVVHDPNIIYHVLVGRFSPHFLTWQKRAEKDPNITLHADIQNMEDLMSACDLAITAGGSTVYELATVGVPFICFSYAENQELLVDYIGQNQIAGSAGAWHRDREACREKIRHIFTELCENRPLREQYFQSERKMTDGQGALRVAGIVTAGK